MRFEVVGAVEQTEVIAVGSSIREIGRLLKVYGRGRWRKLKGIATIRLPDGTMEKVELHWYEAHGIGQREHKIKTFL